MMRIICLNVFTANLALAAGQTKPALVALTLGAAAISLLVGVLNELTFGDDE